MKLEERLGANKYYVDETSPHILVDGAGFSHEEKMKLVNGCPAGLYTLQENGDLAFDFAGCLRMRYLPCSLWRNYRKNLEISA